MASGYSSSRMRASRFFFFALSVVVVSGGALYVRHHLLKDPVPVPLASTDATQRAIIDSRAVPLMVDGMPDGADKSSRTTTPLSRNAPGASLAQAGGLPGVTPKASQATQHTLLAASAATNPLPAGSSDKMLADAKAKVAVGDLVAARDILNLPLVTHRLSDSEAQPFRDALVEINQKLVFSAKRFAGDPFEDAVQVQPGFRLQKLANQYDVTWPLLCRINGYEPTDAAARRIRVGQTLKTVRGPFFAVVSKSAFRMDMYVGGLPGANNCTYVTSFPVGLGRDDSTPTGLWTVELHNKLRNPTYYSPHGEGIIKPDDPKNPLGGFWIGIKGEDGAAIGKNSYGIHGTIDPDSIGKQASMGCIRLRHDDIALVYDLLVEVKSQVIVQQ